MWKSLRDIPERHVHQAELLRPLRLDQVRVRPALPSGHGRRLNRLLTGRPDDRIDQVVSIGRRADKELGRCFVLGGGF